MSKALMSFSIYIILSSLESILRYAFILERLNMNDGSLSTLKACNGAGTPICMLSFIEDILQYQAHEQTKS